MFQKAIYVSLKNNFIAKNCYPSSEPSASCNLFAGGGSCLDVGENTVSVKHKKQGMPVLK